jgi:histidine triad (HIT) family protein
MEKNCVFCQIIRGERPAEVLDQDDAIIVFRDITPHAPVHILIVPKKHIQSLNDLTEQDSRLISNMILRGKMIAESQSISQSGYKLLFNVGRGGGQVIFHLHMHLLGGW